MKLRSEHPNGWASFLGVVAALTLLLSADQSVMAKQEKAQTVTGTVQKAGDGTLTIRLKGPEAKTLQVQVEKDTKITLNGDKVDLGELKQGDQVRVTTSKDNQDLAANVRASRNRQEAREETGQGNRGGGTAEQQQGPSAILGIVAVRPRGQEQVMLLRVAPQGPAGQAGLQSGDEILSVNGQKVTAPSQLGELIGEKKPGTKVRITYRRDGEEKTTTAKLASPEEMMARSGEPRQRQQGEAGRQQARQERQGETGQQAWLGVLLQPEPNEQGLRIVRVLPGGPAQKAGIEEGDVIHRIAGQQVDSPQAASQIMEEKKPGEQVKIVVLRDGSEKTLTAKLAAREEGGERFRMGRQPLAEQPGMQNFPPTFQPGEQQRVEQAIEQLREQVRQLQKEVRELKEQAARQ